MSAGAASDLTCWLDRVTCETTPMLRKKSAQTELASSESTVRIFDSVFFKIFQSDPRANSFVFFGAAMF